MVVGTSAEAVVPDGTLELVGVTDAGGLDVAGVPSFFRLGDSDGELDGSPSGLDGGAEDCRSDIGGMGGATPCGSFTEGSDVASGTLLLAGVRIVAVTLGAL